jgi:O-antigen ligase
MVIATRSRFGALLLVPVLLVSLQVMLSYRLRTNLAVATSVLAGGAGLLYAASPSFLQGTLVRFSAEDRSRTDVLPDLLHALGEFFPAGAGIGTFDPVFRASESLFLVDLTYVHHAHNEYLELAIEGGLPAILLMLVFVAGFAAQAWRVPDLEARDYLLLKRLSAGAILIMLLHSLVDYPLRTITTQALFAFLSAILFLGRRKRQAA